MVKHIDCYNTNLWKILRCRLQMVAIFGLSAKKYTREGYPCLCFMTPLFCQPQNRGDGGRGGHTKQRQGYFFLIYFFVLSPKMATICSLYLGIFHKFDKNVFSQNYFFPQELCMWNQFPLIDICSGIHT